MFCFPFIHFWETYFSDLAISLVETYCSYHLKGSSVICSGTNQQLDYSHLRIAFSGIFSAILQDFRLDLECILLYKVLRTKIMSLFSQNVRAKNKIGGKSKQ